MKFLFIILFCLGAQAQSITTSNLNVGTLYFASRLSNDATTNLNGLAATSGTQTYNPNVPNLGTNRQVCTWPVNLSCTCFDSASYQNVLLAPNVILLNGHYSPSTSWTFNFLDTNGVPYTAGITGLVQGASDMVLGMMSSNLPPSVVVPWILPPTFTNRIYGHSPVGFPAFWAHNKTSQLEAVVINSWVPGGTGGYLASMGFSSSTGYAKGGTGPMSGDSGSPTFFMIHNQPVLLGAMTYSVGSFCCVSDGINWNVITNALGGTNGLKILNLSSYPTF